MINLRLSAVLKNSNFEFNEIISFLNHLTMKEVGTRIRRPPPFAVFLSERFIWKLFSSG